MMRQCEVQHLRNDECDDGFGEWTTFTALNSSFHDLTECTEAVGGISGSSVLVESAGIAMDIVLAICGSTVDEIG